MDSLSSPTPSFCAFIIQAGTKKRMMKRLEMFPRHSSGVSLRVCALLSVNSTLIALALQLGNLQAEGKLWHEERHYQSLSVLLFAHFNQRRQDDGKITAQMNPPATESIARSCEANGEASLESVLPQHRVNAVRRSFAFSLLHFFFFV